MLLHGRYAMLVRERIYGRDQTVTPIDEDTTELRCTMQNEENIMCFVMGFGSHCEVVSPQWLKDRVKDEAEKYYRKVHGNHIMQKSPDAKMHRVIQSVDKPTHRQKYR